MLNAMDALTSPAPEGAADAEGRWPTPALVRLAGLATTAVYAAFIVWVYAAQPRTLSEVRGGVAASIGAYRIDAAPMRSCAKAGGASTPTTSSTARPRSRGSGPSRPRRAGSSASTTPT
jgi:hypothetical protein